MFEGETNYQKMDRLQMEALDGVTFKTPRYEIALEVMKVLLPITTNSEDWINKGINSVQLARECVRTADAMLEALDE